VANSFENEMSESAQHLGICYQKLAIPMRLCHMTKRLIKLKTNPYDAFAIHEGRHYALELKSLDEHGSFPLVNIEPHQIEGLQSAAISGAKAFLLVNMRRQKGKTANRAWSLPIEYWDELLALLETAKRKSIPYRYFTEELLFTELPRRRVENAFGAEELVWDLRVPLGIVTEPVKLPALDDEPPYDPENPWALPPVEVRV
jgi:penicillin-binding protein-related factor A (putative recombinase)